MNGWLKAGALALAVLAGAALLSSPLVAEARFGRHGGGSGYGMGTGTGPNFVDNNGDGICDWAQDPALWNQVTRGRYGEWVDADGDGVCDNYPGPRDGTGYGYKGGR
jgi:hypothetical protein